MKKRIFPLLLAAILSVTVPAELLDSGESQIELSSGSEELTSVIQEPELPMVTAGTDAVVSEPEFEKPVITGLYNSKNGGDLRWKAVPGADKYAIYRTNAGKRVKIATTANTTYMDTSIKNNCWGKVYAYSVAPMKNGKTYERGESKTLQRLAPMKITSLKYNQPNAAIVQFAISTGENKANGYEVQFARSTSDLYGRTGTYHAFILDGRKNMAANVTPLASGRTYYFRVRAYVNYTHSVTKVVTRTWSQYSETKSITIPKESQPVVRPTATPTPKPTATPRPKPTATPTPTPKPAVEDLPPEVPENQATYVCNMNTKKFHRTSCHKVDEIYIKNKRFTDWDRDSIIELGFSPCKICYP